MKKSHTCPKCRSTDIVKDALAVDRGDKNMTNELSVATYGRPEAVFFKQMHRTSLSAWVCVSCGFVEFYADDPGQLRIPPA